MTLVVLGMCAGALARMPDQVRAGGRERAPRRALRTAHAQARALLCAKAECRMCARPVAARSRHLHLAHRRDVPRHRTYSTVHGRAAHTLMVHEVRDAKHNCAASSTTLEVRHVTWFHHPLEIGLSSCSLSWPDSTSSRVSRGPLFRDACQQHYRTSRNRAQRHTCGLCTVPGSVPPWARCSAVSVSGMASSYRNDGEDAHETSQSQGPDAG